MTVGVTYIVFTPAFGYLTDRGLDGLLTCLNSCIALAFIFLGPIPPLSFLGSSLWLAYLAIGMSGLGSAETYNGALLYMMKCARESGLPESEQTRGMVSSLWVVADCVGWVVGSAAGGVAFDTIIFEWVSMAMALTIKGTVLVVGAVFVNTIVRLNRHHKIITVNEDLDESPALLMIVNIA